MQPDSWSHVEAASIPLVGLTTMQALVDRAQAKPGQRILIHAGSGGIGTFAIQYAKLLGLHVTTTTSSKNVDLVQQLGADEVICYDKEDSLKRNAPFDIIYDTLGGAIRVRRFRWSSVVAPSSALLECPIPIFLNRSMLTGSSRQ